ncbi:MAG: dihydrofolate reductase family protein [Deltaproteobacteria bacterium]|nr:dihydrofolate reductase family protein [Deltaproteobacteria bacterium]
MTTTTNDPQRPQCSVFIAMSLDGFIARPDGAVDWLDRVDMPDEDFGFFAFFNTVDAVVFGRKTWDVACGFSTWLYGEKSCFVLTNRDAEPKHGEEFLRGTAEDVVVELARRGMRRAYIDGGIVIRQFLDAGLIDDITVSIIPIVLGDGIRLFDIGTERALTLEECRSWPTGLVQVKYTVGAKP